MKFTDGAWLVAKGVTPFHCKRVSSYQVRGDALYLAAPDRKGKEGIDRVEGTVLEVAVTSPSPDVIRVQARHHSPARRGHTKFDLDYRASSAHVRIDDEPDHLVFTSGRLSLRIRKSTWEMRFEDGDTVVTRGDADSLGYMRVAGQGDFITQRLSLAVGECIYGMGERFGPLVKNGQTVTIWNEDGGTVSDQAYKNIPFYLSSSGYGLLVNTPGKVEFEVATERVSQVQFSVGEEELDYYVFYGPDPKDVLDKYTRLSGRPALPPAWSFGLWLSTSFTTHYNETTVNEFVDGMIDRGIPLKVFHFDCFWMKERQWCDFQWDRDAFPDPEGMLRRLKAKGLKVCVWINPYISQMSPLFHEGREHGYFLKTRDGSVYQRDQWQPGMAFVDFTNPDAVHWYQSKLRELLTLGVDCFKTDFGERIPEDAVYHDGSDPLLMHNLYPYLYNKAVFDLLEEFHGKNNALVFARSATAGCQKFPVHWGGDCEATFESMAEDLRGGLSFCASGAAFWSHDIGGFSGTASPDVYKRWVAFGLLSTHSRLHGNSSYRVPWLFDDESVDVMRHFTRLKNRLFPYQFAAAHDAADKGWPVMRAMVLEYPGDPGCRYLDRQYMLGPSLLVAPVFRADGVAEYYLPEGKWTHLVTGEAVDGGRWRRETLDFSNIPLFARGNAIIPMSGNADRPEWNAGDELVLHVTDLADGGEVSCFAVPNDAAGRRATFRCQRSGNHYTLHSNGVAQRVRVLLRSQAGTGGEVSNGRAAAQTPLGLQVDWTDVRHPIVIDVSATVGTASAHTRTTTSHTNPVLSTSTRSDGR
jgi:alpha-D-xyloside xylohydrolase